MCLLINLRGKFPSEDILRAGAAANKDGIGIAYKVPDGMVEFKKEITFEELMSYKDTITHGMIHFRMASIGPATPELCHPFEVNRKGRNNLSGKVKSVLAHNGHWWKWRETLMNNLNHIRLPQGDFSDTRAIAILAAVHGRNFLQMIDEKIILLNTKGQYVFGKGWLERDGFDLSNDPMWRSRYDYDEYYGYGNYQRSWENGSWKRSQNTVLVSDDMSFVPEENIVGKKPTETVEQYYARCAEEEFYGHPETENEEGCYGYLNQDQQAEIRDLLKLENEAAARGQLILDGGLVEIYDD